MSKFEHTLVVRHLSFRGQKVVLQPNPQQRDKLKDRFDWVSLDHFQSILDITPKDEIINGEKCTVVQIKGRVKARLVQPCSVTLEPLTVEIDEEHEDILAPEELLVNESLRLKYEPYTQDQIDLADLSAQWLFMSTDPYIRKADLESSPEKAWSSDKVHEADNGNDSDKLNRPNKELSPQKEDAKTKRPFAHLMDLLTKKK
jgi:uncharacterized metal-binding protein YceD (DUF177 family)